MKLLFFLSFISLFFTNCNSSKPITRNNPSVADAPSVTISLLIETAYNHTGLNDVLSACSDVRPFKTFNVNFVTHQRMELKLVYGGITQSQRDELYDRLNGLGVKVLNISGN